MCKMNKNSLVKKVLYAQKIKNVLQKVQPCDKLKNYNAGEVVHAKQIAFHKCTKRNRWVFGGTKWVCESQNAGKTRPPLASTIFFSVARYSWYFGDFISP